MLGGWILDLGDGVDAIHVEFVKVFGGMFFLILRGYSIYELERGPLFWKKQLGGSYEYFIFNF